MFHKILVSYSKKLLGLCQSWRNAPLLAGCVCLFSPCMNINPVVTGSESRLLLHISLLHDPYIPDGMETGSSSLTPSKHHSLNFQIGMK
jgi:hypothetical protein